MKSLAVVLEESSGKVYPLPHIPQANGLSITAAIDESDRDAWDNWYAELNALPHEAADTALAQSAGANSDTGLTFEFTSAQTNLDLGDADKDDFLLTIYAVSGDTKATFYMGRLTLVEDSASLTTPPPPAVAIYATTETTDALDERVTALEEGGGGGGGSNTNLTLTRTSTAVTVVATPGTDAEIPAADGTNAGVMTAAQYTKLAGIATSATANSSDATLLARSNHTGTQAANTITGLATVATSGSAADLTGTLAAARIADASLSIAKTSGLQTALDGKSDTSHTHSFSSLTSTPTTRDGYGITDVPTLAGDGKIDTAFLPDALLGSVNYRGTWNASTNSPTLTNGTGSKGTYYVVTVAGTRNLGSGSIAFGVGDWALHNGTAWEKVDASDAVASVAGKVGVVTLDSGDITDWQAGVESAITAATGITPQIVEASSQVATPALLVRNGVGGSNFGAFDPSALTGERTYGLPDDSGTLALTSQFSDTSAVGTVPRYHTLENGVGIEVEAIRIPSAQPLSWPALEIVNGDTTELTTVGAFIIFSGEAATRDWSDTRYIRTSNVNAAAATFLTTPSSANLLAALTTKTGTGNAVFATSPTLVTPILGTPTSGTLTNCTGLPVGGITATGTPSSTTYLRGDGTWSTPAGGGGGLITGGSLTMATGKILGRSTASTGAIEEITIGSGLSLAAGTLTATGSGGSGGTKTIARFRPMDADFPASDFATLTTRNAISFLRFADQATNVAARFCSCVPEGANLASGFKIRIWFVSETATSGNARFGVRIERGSTDLDADSFDTAVEAHTATNGTSGILTCLEITTTNLDSLSAGEFFRLEVYRDCSDTTNDTVSGNVDVALVEVQTAA